MRWLRKARELGGSALWVGLILWHLAGLRKTRTFAVSTAYTRRWGVGSSTKSRALKVLAGARLITIENHGKHSPVVSLVVPPAG